MRNSKRDRRSRQPRAGQPAPRHRGPGRRRPAEAAGLWLFGTHAVMAAIANPKRRIRRILTTAEPSAHEGDIAKAVAHGDWERADVTRQEIEALLPEGAVHQGIAAEVEPLPERSIEDLCLSCDAVPRAAIVALDKVTDPRNIGAVLRSVAAFGGAGVVVPDRGAPLESGTLAKAASGALERVPIVRVVNLKRALETMKRHGIWCLGFDGSAETSLPEAPSDGRVALVLGAEGAGLRRLTRESCDLLVRIPITSEVESLNVSTAAAVALYEWARPR